MSYDSSILLPPPSAPSASYRYGTVEALNPLRVRVDGSESPVSSAPSTLVPLSVGDRVRIQIYQLRMVVIGVVGGPRPPVDPTTFIDNARVMCTFPMYDDDEDRAYSQGISVNEGANELYVNFGGGSYGWQRFEVRDLTTGERISAKTFPAGQASYTEGFPWFYEGGDLCFIVRLQPSAALPSTYQILNYTQATLGASIEINGKVRGDVSGDYYVTTDAYSSTGSKFWIYSWESVKSGAPELLATVPFSNPGVTPAKLQGIAAVESTFYLIGGNAKQDPTVWAYDWTGQLLFIRKWSRPEFYAAVNADHPGAIQKINFEWESEGGTASNGRLITSHVIGDGRRDSEGAYLRHMIIVKHGDPTGSRMAPSPIVGYARDTGWVPFVARAGFSMFNGDRALSWRVKDGELKIRGGVSGDFALGYNTIADSIPGGSPAPLPLRVEAGEKEASGFILIDGGATTQFYARTTGPKIETNGASCPLD